MKILTKYAVVVFLMLGLGFPDAFAQKVKKETKEEKEGEIVMTQEELESFLTKIAEKRREQLAKQKKNSSWDPMSVMMLSGGGHDVLSQDLYYRELKLLHDKIDFLLARQGYSGLAISDQRSDLSGLEQQLAQLNNQVGSQTDSELAGRIAILTQELQAIKSSQPASSPASIGAKHTLYFSNNSVKLSNSDLSALKEWVNGKALSGNTVIKLHGFASKVGNAEYNHKLSFNRANVVKDVLVEMGVSPAKILVMYHGADKTKDDKLARRVELEISNP